MSRRNTIPITLLALALAQPALALQAAGSLPSLPPGPVKSESPRPQGPVDADNPRVQPQAQPQAQPRPEPVASSAPAPAPSPTVASTTSPSPAATSTKPAPGGAPQGKPSASHSPAASSGKTDNQAESKPSGSPSATPEAIASAPASTATALPAAAPAPTIALPDLTVPLIPGVDNRIIAALAAVTAVLLATLFWLIRRRRKPGEDLSAAEGISGEPQAFADDLTGTTFPSETETEVPDEAPAPPAALMPAGAIAGVGAPISLSLNPVKLSATLMAASLNYRLEVTNTADFALEDIAIGGGMISAHASLPVEHQLGTDGQVLALLHRIPNLGAGETVEVTGDLRLPLTEIKPIRSGEALLFIPLARFRAEVRGADSTAAFVIGETPPVAAAALLPFRIDLGPRIWSRISKRSLDQGTTA